MKLHPFGRATAMADAHHFVFVGPRSDFEFRRNRISMNDEAVITGSLERIRHAAEHTLPIVMNERRLAMHDAVVANDGAPENVPHALMTETDSENWSGFGKAFDDVARNARFGR